MNPAPDNYEVNELAFVKYEGCWWVAFLDEDGNKMRHKINLITSTSVHRSEVQVFEYARIIALTKWGAQRIVKKFLAGKIPDHRLPTRLP